jgi:tetratricopeptide (TPR) repeat protein
MQSAMPNRAFWCLLALASLAQVRGQNIAIRTTLIDGATVTAETDRGVTPVKVEALTRAPELLIVLAQDALLPADYIGVRKFVADVFRTKPLGTTIQLAVLRHSGMLDINSPVRSTAALQTVLRNTVPDDDASLPASDIDYLGGIATSLDASASSWGFTVVIGRIPDAPQDREASLSRFAGAWFINKFVDQKRSLVFWDPSGSQSPQLADWLTRNTGGSTCFNAADLGTLLASPAQLASLNWDAGALSRGFEARMARIKGLGENSDLPEVPVTTKSLNTLPSIQDYISMRADTRQAEALLSGANPDLALAHALLAKALAINPADPQAVKFGIALAEKAKDRAEEIPLLETAVELTPDDAEMWATLGDLRYLENNLAMAEPALVRARELGVKRAGLFEELGRIRLDRQDLQRASEYIGESLNLNPSQLPLWLLLADISKSLARVDRQTEALEKALAIGGELLPRRIELIRIYLAQGDLANVARHVDIELPRLPANPDTQTIWAGFYERLGRPDDALVCWRRVVTLDRTREPAHFAIASIYQNRSQWKDALEASDDGLQADGKSARLTLIKSNALERLDRVYQARQTLNTENTDLSILKRQAEITDTFGGDSPAAYRKYVEALLSDVTPRNPGQQAEFAQVLERSRKVAMREGDMGTLEWIESKVPNRAAREGPAPSPETGVWITGGIEALAFAAQGQVGGRPGQFFVDYCRTILAHTANANSKETAAYQKGLADYFDQLRLLMPMATRTGSHATLTLSLAKKQGQEQAEKVLSILGWKLVRAKQTLTIESGEKAADARKQNLASALAIDQGGMQRAFSEGKPFEIDIPFEWAPLVLGDDVWRKALQADKLSGGVAEAFSQNPDYARAYLGLSSVGPATAAVLAFNVGLPALVTRYSRLLAFYASALSIHEGRAVTPGGADADAAWISLSGASPADPVRFFRALFEKDDGKVLAWLFALSQLDPPHQRFFTLSTKRMTSFYQAFSQSQDVQSGAARMIRDGSFAEFMREIPLDGTSVNFPGSGQVWMVARGNSSSQDHTQRLLNKVRKAVAPEVEDEILLRLARTHNKSLSDHVSELDNFLAVVRIAAHRSDSLDDESVLMLAQNFDEFESIYPYFADFRKLRSEDFTKLFAFLSKMRSGDEVDSESILGQFYASLELIRLAKDFGGLPEDKANQLVTSLSSGFLAATDLAASSSAALDVVRELIASKPMGSEISVAKGPADPDRVIENLLLGSGEPVQFEWEGVSSVADAIKTHTIAYRRVLELQKIPSIATLLRMDEALRRIAAGNVTYAPLIETLRKDLATLPAVGLAREMKVTGTARKVITRSDPAPIAKTLTELSQAVSKKKVDAGDVRKLVRQMMEEFGPQVKIALTGAVYAVFMSPEDTLVEDDPLLVRKHRAFDVTEGAGKRSRFTPSQLTVSSTGEGSYFSGGFGQFAVAAVKATPHRRGVADSEIYSNQLAAIRAAQWWKFGDNDQQLLGLKIRIAREWCVYASENPALLADLAEDTTGILSLSRRRDLLNSIASGSGRDVWSRVWQDVTLSDLLALADRYLARYSESPWNSPVDLALRHAARLSDGSSLRILGSLPATLYGCNHPDLVTLATYEEYEHHLFPTQIAERSAEMNLYLANLMDRLALPAALMPVIAEPVAKKAFSAMRMSDERDWMAAIRAFNAIDGNSIGTAIGASK